MFCKKCGTQLDDGVKFCKKCGAIINTQNTPQPQNNKYDAPDIPQKSEKPEKPKGTGGNKWLIIGIVAAILVICAVIVLVINPFNQNNEQNGNTPAEQAATAEPSPTEAPTQEPQPTQDTQDQTEEPQSQEPPQTPEPQKQSSVPASGLYAPYMSDGPWIIIADGMFYVDATSGGELMEECELTYDRRAKLYNAYSECWGGCLTFTVEENGMLNFMGIFSGLYELYDANTPAPTPDMLYNTNATPDIYNRILPDSAFRVYTTDELLNAIIPWVNAGYTELEALRLARNEIFAVHSVKFNDETLNYYFYSERMHIFGSQPYQTASEAQREFNNYENQNIDIIKLLEEEIKQYG